MNALRNESGSSGSSVVGQATELPLESDFYIRFNSFVLTLLKECLASFSPASVVQTLQEIRAWLAPLDALVAKTVIKPVKSSVLTKKTIFVRQAPVEPMAVWTALLLEISRPAKVFPLLTAEPLLDGEIRLGKRIVQEEFTNKLAVSSAAFAQHSRSFFRQLLIDLDVSLWSWRTKLALTYKRFSFNPQPVYNRAMRYAGTGFVGVALFTIIFFGAPFLALELRSMVFRATAPLVSQAEPQQQPVVTTAPPIQNPDPDKQFQILIPQIGVNAKVLANIDANNPAEYDEALMHGVAHAKGTGLPGDDGGHNKTIFIFSHSTNGSWNITRFNALFYSLKDLKNEDQIQIWFWGKEYWYKVIDKKIVEPNDVSFLAPQTEQEKLVLQTCWPPGTTQKRLIITATRVGQDLAGQTASQSGGVSNVGQ